MNYINGDEDMATPSRFVCFLNYINSVRPFFL